MYLRESKFTNYHGEHQGDNNTHGDRSCVLMKACIQQITHTHILTVHCSYYQGYSEQYDTEKIRPANKLYKTDRGAAVAHHCLDPTHPFWMQVPMYV